MIAFWCGGHPSCIQLGLIKLFAMVKKGAQSHSTWRNCDHLEWPQRGQRKLQVTIATWTSQRSINQRGIYEGLCWDALRRDSSLGICGIPTLSPSSPFFKLTHNLAIVWLSALSFSLYFTFLFTLFHFPFHSSLWGLQKRFIPEESSYRCHFAIPFQGKHIINYIAKQWITFTFNLHCVNRLSMQNKINSLKFYCLNLNIECVEI